MAWITALAAVALVAVSLSSSATAGSSSYSGGKIDDPEECLEAVPAAASVAGVTDTGEEVVLDVHVLLDGVTEARGAEVMRQMSKAYEPVNIAIRPVFQTIAIEHQRKGAPNGTDPEKPTSDASYLFQQAKQAVGEVRPQGTDVVYLLTSAEITGVVAGMADCIGGVRYPNRAFAIGEEAPDYEHSSTLNFCCTWITAKIAGHELAHLLGAHHHYANCAEGAPTAVEDRHAFTCTMMFNDVGAVNLRFSTVEAAVVRGHALEYAHERVDPPPSDPDPAATYGRTLTLEFRKHLIARGRLSAGDAQDCVSSMELRVERWNGGKWRVAQEVVTKEDGTFRTRLKDRPGRYRAHARETEVGGGSSRCGAAASAPVRHRH